jgi:transketolase
LATRDASQRVLQALAATVPSLVGGSADLAPSTKTIIAASGYFSAADASGRNIHFGVREHAMVAILNGMALHGGILPYGATFLNFSDYARGALRLSALQQTHAIFIFTHDSIGLGEDGPTHQPVEQLAALRAIPGFTLIRPADANETVAAWRLALGRRGPTALVLTRQKLPILDAGKLPIAAGTLRGGYVLSESDRSPPRVVLVATGSEVSTMLEAQTRLQAEGIPVRVVSLPCWNVFDEQTEEYRASVLLPGTPTVSMEAASTFGWERYVGPEGRSIGVDRFGASAPGSVVLKELGISADHAVATVRGLLEPRRTVAPP